MRKVNLRQDRLSLRHPSRVKRESQQNQRGYRLEQARPPDVFLATTDWRSYSTCRHKATVLHVPRLGVIGSLNIHWTFGALLFDKCTVHLTSFSAGESKACSFLRMVNDLSISRVLPLQPSGSIDCIPGVLAFDSAPVQLLFDRSHARPSRQ